MVRHSGGTFETLIDYEGPGGRYDDVLCRYQSRVEAMHAHVKLEQFFVAEAAKRPNDDKRMLDDWEYSQDLWKIGNDIIDRSPRFMLYSFCCDEELHSQDRPRGYEPTSENVFDGFLQKRVQPVYCSSCQQYVDEGYLVVS
jgi:hypothetical protein